MDVSRQVVVSPAASRISSGNPVRSQTGCTAFGFNQVITKLDMLLDVKMAQALTAEAPRDNLELSEGCL